jgi:diguanylate cyclase (GGDEF)-like protein
MLKHRLTDEINDSMLLKHKFNIIIFVTALVSSGLAYFTSIWVLEKELASSIDGQKAAIISSIESDISVFDSLLMMVEQQWEDELEQTLPKVASALAAEDLDDPAVREDLLASLKTQYNLSDLHLINKELIVHASTFEKEIGLDIASFSDDYTLMIQNVLNNKVFATHRISLSTMTGRVKKYGYYSFPQTDYIVNGDIDVHQRLTSEKNNTVGEFLFGDYKDKIVSKYDLVSDIDLFLISQSDYWSFFNLGKHVDHELAKRLYAGETPPSNDTLVLKHIAMDSYDILGFKAFLQIQFHQEVLQRSKYELRLAALSIALIVITGTFLLLHFGLRRTLVDRFSNLLQQIKDKEEVSGRKIALSGNDELVELSNAINDMMSSLTAEQHRNQHLSNMFNQDGLTNIDNRRGFDARFEIEWAQAQRDKTSLSILMLDVDYFKEYNDFYGHILGDETLIIIAKTIVNKLARPSDFTARYGGEEFVCLLPDTDSDGAAIISEQIRLAVESRKIQHKASKVSSVVTISIGCLTISGSTSMSKTKILKHVDTLLYQSKRNGRNRVTVDEIS